MISVSLQTHASEVVLPKPLIIELVERHCSSPEPNPRVTADLEYYCSDKYDDADGGEQSMNYSLRLIPLIAQDFNQDGIQDLALEVESSGPLGGSVYTNSAIHYLILNKKQKIVRNHEVLLYAPFSEHIVEYEVKGKQIYYSAVPNYRSHPEAYEDGVLIDQPLEFTVNWEKSIPISTHYRDSCQLSNNTDKRIFTIENGVKRIDTIDIHDYTHFIEEELQIDNMQISAELNGCDTQSVSFSIRPSNEHNSLPVLADILQTLIPVTVQHPQLSALLILDRNSQITFGEVIPLGNNWTGQVHIQRSFDNANVIINLAQEK